MDFLGGLIMLQIIFLHLSLTYTSVSWVGYFYSLWSYSLPCLAWFFYKGGMFYKTRPLKQVITTSAKRLLVPYIFFTIIGFISQIIIDYNYLNTIGWAAFLSENIKNCLLFGVLGIDGPIWYLLVFYGVKILYTWLRSSLKLKPIYIILGCFLCAFGMWYIFLERNYIFWIGAIACNLVFFACGDYLREKQFKYPMPTILVSLAVVVLLAISHIEYLSLRTNGGWQEYSINGYILSYPLVIASILLVNNLVRWLPINIKSASFINNMGRQSMSWFLLHHFILTWSVFLLGLVGISKSNPWAPLISLIAIFVLIPPCEKWIMRYAPWILGASRTKHSANQPDRLP